VPMPAKPMLAVQAASAAGSRSAWENVKTPTPIANGGPSSLTM